MEAEIKLEEEELELEITVEETTLPWSDDDTEVTLPHASTGGQQELNVEPGQS